jgi:hypothetical protein
MGALPYIATPGNIDKALTGIKNAAVPDRVSQDFVKTILKIPGGSGDQMTSFLKKLGLTNTDGSPNDLYKKFRNPTSSAGAIAEAIRISYASLYIRNEYMHELNDAQLRGLVVEETGQKNDSSQVRLIFSCIKHLKQFADFNSKEPAVSSPMVENLEEKPKALSHPKSTEHRKSIGLNLGYTININLPASTDPAVFDAIFKAIREHMLSEDDA